MTETVPFKELNDAERHQGAAMAINIAKAVQEILKRRPTDLELDIVAEEVWECFATGITDQREVFLHCLLNLPDWKNDRDAITAMLTSLKAGDDPMALMRYSLNRY